MSDDPHKPTSAGPEPEGEAQPAFEHAAGGEAETPAPAGSSPLAEPVVELPADEVPLAAAAAEEPPVREAPERPVDVPPAFGPGASAPASRSDRPEILAGAAFAGGLAFAMLLKRLAR